MGGPAANNTAGPVRLASLHIPPSSVTSFDILLEIIELKTIKVRAKTKSSGLNEQNLINQIVQKQDKSALATLYKNNFDDVYRFVFSRVGSKEVTEDIVSETWLALINNLEKFNGNSKFKTFAFGFALNMIRRYIQKNSTKTAELTEDILEIEDAPLLEQKLIRLEKHLIKVLNKLAKNYREVLETRFLKGLNITETALQLNMSAANVRVVQHRAIKKAQEIANTMNLSK